jgi:hypothetical protein
MIDNYNKKQLFEKRVFSKLNRGKHSNRSSYFNINKDMLTSKTTFKLKSLDNVTLNLKTNSQSRHAIINIVY